ncbi:superinfection immunity protein [Actinomadura sp. 9N407]|uniref:superinfection immunity protein n=1 Tax=Actinomadura sp. 9N407 TaxID=3375154 RepID=UPI0037B50E4C
MYALTSNSLFWLLLIGGLIVLAVLPTLIALARGADEIMLIVLVNVLGCAIVLGWPVALLMAIKWPRRSEVLRRPRSQRRSSPT